MKKLMFVLAFACIALFASASNGIGTKINHSKKKVNEKVFTAFLSVQQYAAGVTCGGHTYTDCCYNSVEEAAAGAKVLAAKVCVEQ